MTNTNIPPSFISDILKEDLKVLHNSGNEDENNYISVNLLNDDVKVFFKKGFKFFSYNDFLTIIQSKINRGKTADLDETSEVFLPPSNMFFLQRSKSKIKLSCYYPSAVRTLMYKDDTVDILTPNIIISHRLTLSDPDWIISSSKYYCTDLAVGALPKGEFISDIDSKNRIFLMPMSNTYREGKMCFGSNSMPSRFTDGNFRGLDWYFKYLWETPFNDDLGIHSLKQGMDVGKWYTLLKDLATKKKDGEEVSFPYDLLR